MNVLWDLFYLSCIAVFCLAGYILVMNMFGVIMGGAAARAVLEQVGFSVGGVFVGSMFAILKMGKKQ